MTPCARAVSAFSIRRRIRTPGIYATLTVVLLVTAAAFLSFGALPVSPRQVVAILAHQAGFETTASWTTAHAGVVLSVRVPRLLMGAAVGAGLAMCGATLQAVFGNPLADPGLIGISSGATLAAAAATIAGDTLLGAPPHGAALFLLPVAAFVGGLGASVVVYRYGRVRGQVVVATMLLAGIAIGTVASALTGLLVFTATDAQMRSLVFWSLGSLGGAAWIHVAAVVPLIVGVIALLPRLARALNALLLGDAAARHLGIDTRRVRRHAIMLCALGVGAGVAATGTIGFVGLVVPHLLRLAVGPDHRVLLPASGLLGASLLLAADILARTVVAPAELPLGIVTALIGAPFFLWLLRRPSVYRVAQ